MPQLEVWEKVFVSNEEFLGDTHGSLGCAACHGGDVAATEMDTAHDGMTARPDEATTCASCHPETVEHSASSLHSTLDGYWTALGSRASNETVPALMEAFDNHCASCHTTCGQCHVSRPASTGGGLLSGHEFKATPPMNTTCVGCHGSRVDSEFKGRNVLESGVAIPADVHYNPNGMACFTCHSGDQMHGTSEMDVNHRYDGDLVPACTDCHPDREGTNVQHTEGHLEELSCQVCHAAEYKNCFSCHVQKSDSGVPYFQTAPSTLDVLIGQNWDKTEARPWSWVVVRHVPIDPDSFSYYGENLLPNFDNRPTWMYATPHTIQKNTAQNASCTACHGNPDVFLTADKVSPEELAANEPVIVEQLPSMGG